MSILIKGLTIPPDSDVAGSVSLTIIRAHDGTLFARDDEFHYGEDKGRGYKAIELPPHGRLIDAEAFIAEQRHLYCENCARRKGIKNGKMKFVYDIGDAPCRACGYGDVLDDIEDAPTIIESEGEE